MPEKINWMPDKLPPLPPEEIERINDRNKPNEEQPRPAIDINIEPPPTRNEKPKEDSEGERGVWTTDI